MGTRPLGPLRSPLPRSLLGDEAAPGCLAAAGGTWWLGRDEGPRGGKGWQARETP